MDTTAIQRALVALGYDPGAIDGKPGPKTKRAIEDFQRDHGLHVDGIAGPKTIEALNGARGAQPLPPGDAGFAFPQPPTKRRIEEIIIHCTATPEGRAVSVDTIRGWHKAQGWKDIGYHWVVLLDGTVKPGRPEAEIGSHVAGHNTGTLGVVYVGGVAADGKTAKDTRTPAQRAALLSLVKGLITRYPNVKMVTGHNQYANKACPSFDVRKDELGRLV